MATFSEMLDNARRKSIADYARSLGLKEKKKGSIIFFSSPFSSDSDPSLAVYKDNHFVDFSNGISGDFIAFFMKVNSMGFKESVKEIYKMDLGSISPIRKPQEKKERKKFDISRYINKDHKEIVECVNYALSRGIRGGFMPGYYYYENKRKKCIMFPHQDETGKIIGVKMRNIVNGEETRFTSRGSLMFYILYTDVIDSLGETKVYFIEGEANANSLYEFLKENMIDAYIISFGSVASVKKKLPEQIEEIKERFVIIDFDGSQDKYNDRILMYKDLGAQPIKMMLNKGEDINSLYSSNKMWLVKNLILN